MKLYSTVKKVAHAEQTIEKSKFIAHIAPVKTKEEADEFIASVRKEYRDATHNVPAIVLGDKMQIQWGSDDGEPQGTSGAPIVQMLVSTGVTNVCVVVTRYFGGIKLGPGGLVRAYTSSAKLALDAAGICDCEERAVLVFNMDYSYLAKLQNAEQIREYGSEQKNTVAAKFRIDTIEYLDQIRITLSIPSEYGNQLIQDVENLTNGTSKLIENRIENII